MKRRTRGGGWGLWLLLAGGLVTAVAPLAAEEAPEEMAEEQGTEQEEEGGEAAEPATKGRTIEEIKVTARRRAESLQIVPEAVSAIAGERLEDLFANNSSDLARVSPNLVFDNVQAASPRAGGVSLRGVSFQDVEPSFDPAVGVVLDDVYLATNIGAVFQLLDIERIEVLRGPQGTLFGKNTVGGVVSVVTRRPSQEGLSGEVRALFGDYTRNEFDAMVSGPLTDELAAKVVLTVRNRDGFTFNRFTQRDEGDVDYKSGTIDLLWTPTDNVEVLYKYQRIEDDTEQQPTLNVSQPTDLLCILFEACATSVTEPSTGDRYVADQNGSNRSNYEADFHILKTQWDVNDRYSFKYILGFRDSLEDVDTDWDGSPSDFYTAENRITDLQQTSHEFQLSYTGTRFSYTGGVYLWDAEYTLTQDTLYFYNLLYSLGLLGELPVEPGVNKELTDHRTDSEALFFQADYDLSERWTLTFGGRYTREKKAMDKAQGWTNYGGLDAAIVLDTRGLDTHDEWSEFTPKLGLRYQVDPDTMTYLTYSSGFRSGGYSGRAATAFAATVPYDPETVDSFEWGYKSELFDRRLRLNTALFYSRYHDKQEEFIDVFPQGQETIIKNAAEVEYKGAELELLALPSEGLTLSFNLGLLDAEYLEFDADLDGDGVVTDNTYLELRRAPDYTATLGVNYQWTVGPGRLSVDGSYHYTDDYFISFLNDPIGTIDAYGLLDASINYEWQDWRVSVFGNNLTDEDYYTHAFSLPGLWAFAYAHEPAIVGVQLRKAFRGR